MGLGWLDGVFRERRAFWGIEGRFYYARVGVLGNSYVYDFVSEALIIIYLIAFPRMLCIRSRRKVSTTRGNPDTRCREQAVLSVSWSLVP